MHLTLFITILIVITNMKRISFFSYLHPWSFQLHQNCLDSLPTNSKSLPELRALVCGADFAQLDSSSIYIATGLIHLFVVSGAHLILIQKILNLCTSFNKPKKWPRLLCLIGLIYFSACCDFNPPVTRALISLILVDDFVIKKQFWPVHFRILIIGLMTLLFNFNWITSLSLQLSWLIALGLLLNREFLPDGHPLVRQSLNYILIFPTLLFLQVPQPIIILIHVIFSTFLEVILFPFALIVRFIHRLSPSFDFLIWILRSVLTKIETPLEFQLVDKPLGLVIFNWGFLFFIHLTLHLYFIQKERRITCAYFGSTG